MKGTFCMNKLLKSACYGALLACVMLGAVWYYKSYRIKPPASPHSSQQPATTVTQQQPNTVKDVAGTEAHERLMEQQTALTNGQKLINDELELSNARLENDIAKLEGRPQNYNAVALAESKVAADRRAGFSPIWKGIDLSASSPTDSLPLLVIIMDCSEAIIEKHNAAFPKDPWAGTADVRDMMGGKPNPIRLARAKACANNGGNLDLSPSSLWEKRLQHTDECLAVFHQTVDKKTVDLTVRENDAINGCKALDLYPPGK